MRNPFVIAIVGPTATGKSALADALAERLGSFVMSADSMQVYRGFDIGTAKTPSTERKTVHYGLDIVDQDEAFNAEAFQAYGRAIIEEALASGLFPIVCGGTGLYVRALLDRMEFPGGGQLDNPVREKWQSFLDTEGDEALFTRLSEVDPDSAAILHPHNHKRVIRALEMYEQGVSYAEQAAGFKERVEQYPTCCLGLGLARKELYRRIDARVDAMIESGLTDEARELYDAGASTTYTARHAIGYKELFRHFAGELSHDEAVEEIKRNTRRYAKRQLTWFKSDERIQWIEVDTLEMNELVARATALIEEFGELHT
jgi:tRNA dimethylallyltransferase